MQQPTNLFKARLVAGETQIGFGSASPTLMQLRSLRQPAATRLLELAALPHAKTGKLRVWAISSPERSALAPEVAPLGDQLGRHDADNVFMLVLMTAGGTPRAIA